VAPHYCAITGGIVVALNARDILEVCDLPKLVSKDIGYTDDIGLRQNNA